MKFVLVMLPYLKHAIITINETQFSCIIYNITKVFYCVPTFRYRFIVLA